jgi:predicted dehydrogenase
MFYIPNCIVSIFKSSYELKELKTMKLALVGLGHVAKYQLQALANLDEVTLVGAHDIESNQAKLLPDGLCFYETLDSLLAECDADIILVSTPNITHYELGKKVLESGHSLLLEKPCCQTEEELTDLLSTAINHNQFFSVALHASYARDLEWYLTQMNSGSFDYGPLTGFHIGFFDPYYEKTRLKSSAASLGGAWFDSGINALSVIGKLIDPRRLKLVESRMTRIASMPCSEIQSTAEFSFFQNKILGHGIIETNWTLGLNRKTTQLFFCESNTQVTLHHSNESVYIHHNGHLIFEKSFQNKLPRLTNHYSNLFRDITQRYRANKNNLDYAVSIHHLLFAATKDLN